MRPLAILALIIAGCAIALGEYDLHTQKDDLIRLYETYISESCALPQPLPEQEI